MMELLRTLFQWAARGEAAGFFALSWKSSRFSSGKTTLKNHLPYVEYGGGGYGVLANGLLIGADGGGGGRIADVGEYKAVAGGGGGGVKTGLLLAASPHTRFYPYVALRAGGRGMTISSKKALRPGEVVARDRASRQSSGGFVADLYLGFTVEFRSSGRLGLLLGFDTGLIIPLIPARPRRYFRLLIGGGYFQKPPV